MQLQKPCQSSGNKHFIAGLGQSTLGQVLREIRPIIRTLEHNTLKSTIRLYNTGLRSETGHMRYMRNGL